MKISRNNDEWWDKVHRRTVKSLMVITAVVGVYTMYLGADYYFSKFFGANLFAYDIIIYAMHASVCKLHTF